MSLCERCWEPWLDFLSLKLVNFGRIVNVNVSWLAQENQGLVFVTAVVNPYLGLL